MNELIITPNKGVGPFSFGMTREEVRNVLGGNVVEYKKMPMSDTFTDAFNDHGIHIYYDSNDTCEAIEMALPADPKFSHKHMIGRPFSELKSTIISQDSDVELDETGLLSFPLGIGLFVPELEDSEDSLVESVIVFKEGYYE